MQFLNCLRLHRSHCVSWIELAPEVCITCSCCLKRELAVACHKTAGCLDESLMKLAKQSISLDPPTVAPPKYEDRAEGVLARSVGQSEWRQSKPATTAKRKHAHTHTRARAHTHTHARAHARTHTHAHTNIQTNTHIYIYIYTRTHARTHARTHTHTHTHLSLIHISEPTRLA